MSTNVNHAVSVWNKEYLEATSELAALEATLKADYNKYIDSLVAYLKRLKSANDVRQGFVRKLEIEDASNGTRTIHEFTYHAKPSLENRADKYVIEQDVGAGTPAVVTTVRACSVESLIQRKVD